MGTILIVILILLVLGAFPALPYNRSWGHSPWVVILIILIIFLLLRGNGVIVI